MATITFTSSGTWLIPAGVTSVTVQCWGSGGNGGNGKIGTGTYSGGGGGGGEYAQQTVTTTPGNSLTITIGNNSSVTGGSATVTAHGGGSSGGEGAGSGGTGSSNTIHFDGGSGGSGATISFPAGGGGGGSAGQSSGGGTGGGGGAGSGGAGGGAGSGSPPGAQGGTGGNRYVSASPGGAPGGGGGGGSGSTGTNFGASGQGGQVTLVYIISNAFVGYAGATWKSSEHSARHGNFKAYAGLTFSFPDVVNAWAASFSQPTSGPMPPGLQSVVIPLNGSTAVLGSGNPSQGTWLFAMVGWQQSMAQPALTFGVGDDIHSFWRPQVPSQPVAGSRTVIWYTPNTARVPGVVYVAPSAAPAGVSVLVVEVAGLGPWDSVISGLPAPFGYNSNYAGNASSLPLSLPAPSSPAFILGAVTGDNNNVSTSFAPAGWNPLPSVIATNIALDDGTFETGVSRWSPSGTCTLVQSSAHANSGTYSALLTVAGSPSNAYFRPDDAVPVLGGTSCTAAMFLYGASVANCSAAIDWRDAAGTYISTSNGSTATATTTWTAFTVTGTAPANAAYAAYGPLIGGSPGNGTLLYTDDVTFTGFGHSNDAVLASAWNNITTSTSVTGNSSSPEDLSGALISVLQAAPSPVPASQNPNWPYTKLELGFGSGFQTPLEQITWTDLSNRALKWDETTGVQYQLGQILSTDLTFELDNFDYALTPTNVSSPYYPNITTGTPIRMRFALGNIGGQVVNRWYVIHRNVLEWPEEITPILRPIISGEGTDGYFDLANTTNTAYRNEVYWDLPYAWWPCDDQPLAYGVLPTKLLNAANGNDNALNIQVSPNGATLQTTYSTTGVSLSTLTRTANSAPADAVGIYTVGASQGWMFGDPQSLFNNNIATGGQATSNPGSAAWEATGQAGNTGSYGWFLYCNDGNFPSVASGVTVEGWFNLKFFGSAQADFQLSGTHLYDVTGQPYSAITLLEMVGLSNPIIKLQVDLSGHLNLLTFNGASSTSHAIYATSDLRAQTWFHVAIELTTTSYLVYVNGGLTAQVAGTATINSGFTWLIVNGDLAANGGSTAGTGLVNGGNVQVSHLAVYPVQLPPWRILAHYWAAIAGSGLIPAPQSPQVQTVQMTSSAALSQDSAVEFTPDGSGTDAAGAGYGQVGSSSGQNVVYSFSLVVVAVAGNYTSGPSAWTNAIGVGFSDTTNANTVGQYVFTSWTGAAAKFAVYTSSAVNAETESVIVIANSDSFSSGFGSSAVSAGPGKLAAGDGSSPPASPSAIGDTVGQRMERILQQGLYTVPLRSVDPSPLLVQAPGPNGAGLATGAYLQAIQTSDDGMFFIDNQGFLTYWQKTHLASQYSSPAWIIGPQTSLGAIPYYREVRWILDPHRVWNAISVQPFDPNSAQLPVYTPSNSAGVVASQKQFGPQPLQVVSWLQSQPKMQTQANWLFANFGQPQRRSENVQIEASAYPAAWQLVVGVNVGDIVQMQDWSIGNTGPSYTYRVTKIHRTFSYGAKGNEVKASVNLQLDWEPNNYWA